MLSIVIPFKNRKSFKLMPLCQKKVRIRLKQKTSEPDCQQIVNLSEIRSEIVFLIIYHHFSWVFFCCNQDQKQKIILSVLVSIHAFKNYAL
jgi:hypothetical protein